MQLTEDISELKFAITSFTEDTVWVNKQDLQKSFILAPDCLEKNWPISEVNNLSSQLLANIYELNPELILLGTGKALSLPPTEIMQILTNKKIPFECMSSQAVCKTFNLLAQEGRKVVAGIIL